MFVIDNNAFLNFVRAKSVICYILIPRLWAGDQSKLFKSLLFNIYQVVFAGLILSVFVYISYESIFKFIQGQYNKLVNEKELRKDMTDDICYSKFYLHK